MPRPPSDASDNGPGRRPHRSWSKRLLAWSFYLIVACLVTSFVFEQVVRWRAARTHQPPGDRLAVGGGNIHFVDIGVGTPTVIFEAGVGAGGTIAWSLVQPEVAKHTRTFSYDRPGLLWSTGKSSLPRTSQHISKHLYDVLQRAQVSGPYLLVGHSLGGPHLQVFADSYPDKVVGLVLVDSSHPEQWNRLPPGLVIDYPPWQLAIFRLASETGMLRLFKHRFGQHYAEPWKSVARDLFPAAVPTVIAELKGINASLHQAGHVGTLGAKPLIVVSGNQRHDSENGTSSSRPFHLAWQEMQTDLLKNSSNSRQIIAHRSGHVVQFDQPDIVIRVILDLVTALRNANGPHLNDMDLGKVSQYLSNP